MLMSLDDLLKKVAVLIRKVNILVKEYNSEQDEPGNEGRQPSISLSNKPIAYQFLLEYYFLQLQQISQGYSNNTIKKSESAIKSALLALHKIRYGADKDLKKNDTSIDALQKKYEAGALENLYIALVLSDQELFEVCIAADLNHATLCRVSEYAQTTYCGKRQMKETLSRLTVQVQQYEEKEASLPAPLKALEEELVKQINRLREDEKSILGSSGGLAKATRIQTALHRAVASSGVTHCTMDDFLNLSINNQESIRDVLREPRPHFVRKVVSYFFPCVRSPVSTTSAEAIARFVRDSNVLSATPKMGA